MHFPSEVYSLAPGASPVALFLSLLALIVAWRILRRTLGDRPKDELSQLSEQFARGLLSLEQFQQQQAKIRRKFTARASINGRA